MVSKKIAKKENQIERTEVASNLIYFSIVFGLLGTTEPGSLTN